MDKHIQSFIQLCIAREGEEAELEHNTHNIGRFYAKDFKVV